MKEFRMPHQMSVMMWHFIRYHLKNKTSVRCARITSDAAVQNAKQFYTIYVLNISWTLTNV